MLHKIVLSEVEMVRAKEVARRQHDDLRARGVADAHGARPGDVTREDEEGGAAAELAASKLFGVKWTTAQPTALSDGPDIGERTQVRHVSRPRSKCLIVRPRDIQKYGDVPFLLMRRQRNEFSVLGWMMAEEAKRIGEWTDKGTGRPPAWFVHESRLHPIEELKSL